MERNKKLRGWDKWRTSRHKWCVSNPREEEKESCCERAPQKRSEHIPPPVTSEKENRAAGDRSSPTSSYCRWGAWDLGPLLARPKCNTIAKKLALSTLGWTFTLRSGGRWAGALIISHPELNYWSKDQNPERPSNGHKISSSTTMVSSWLPFYTANHTLPKSGWKEGKSDILAEVVSASTAISSVCVCVYTLMTWMGGVCTPTPPLGCSQPALPCGYREFNEATISQPAQRNPWNHKYVNKGFWMDAWRWGS